MIQESDLPEGITLNSIKDDTIELDLLTEKVYTIRCKSCDVSFEGVLITNFGRHEGVIKVIPSNTQIWKNPLPKDRNKSIKMLNDTLVSKLEKHRERHKND